jgi:hypothetical protein
MATIRILATVCAALFAGLTLSLGSVEFTPAAAQSATEAKPGAPLNLIPRIAKTKKFSKQARSPTRVAKARTFAKPRRVAQAEPVAKPKTFQRAVQRRAARTRTFARRAVAGRTLAHEIPQPLASGQNERAVVPAKDGISVQAENRVPPASASPWLDTPLAATDPTSEYALASKDGENAGTTADITGSATTDETVQVADATEINEIDLTASETPAPSNKSWFNALLAVLGGAFAAASAARFLLG